MVKNKSADREETRTTAAKLGEAKMSPAARRRAGFSRFANDQSLDECEGKRFRCALKSMAELAAKRRIPDKPATSNRLRGPRAPRAFNYLGKPTCSPLSRLP